MKRCSDDQPRRESLPSSIPASRETWGPLGSVPKGLFAIFFFGTLHAEDQ